MSENLGSLSDIIEVAKVTRHSFGVWPAWRGQESTEPLVPRVYRKHTDDPRWEHNIAISFLLQAKTRYSRCPRSDEWSGWLFLMQHYGLPTRLLDWTNSVLTATYFAVRKDEPGNSLLYALNPILLNKDQANDPVVLQPSSEKALSLIIPVFVEVKPASPHSKILAVGADEIDLRMTVQQSIFTIHSNPSPIDDLENAEDFLIKYIIPAETKSSILNELTMIGITEASLFPDLEALARHLSR